MTLKDQSPPTISAHTPGPWKNDPDTGDVFRDDGDVYPLILTVHHDNVSERQFLADLAAATALPDLIAALELITVDDDGDGYVSAEGMEKIRAAISKAKGGAA